MPDGDDARGRMLAQVRHEAAQPRPSVVAALAALGPAAGWRVLDAGCGPGPHLGLILDAVAPGGTVVGLDLEADRLEVAAAHRAEDVAAGRLRPDQIDEAAVGARMALADLPPPDLFIRTGGDYRISNFLLWQLAYTELWFTETLWPDLDAATLHEAIRVFAGRERRFGLTGEQIAGPTPPPHRSAAQ